MVSRPDPDAVPMIEIIGAREHNLKNLAVRIPRGRFVVVTGVSGSGKSTLAFDLLFAEGQRRFLDAMNTYARQFVDQLARPDVDLILGLPPTVSIEQGTTRGGGKSTVATVTEIHHFVRLLYARLGTQHCPDCGHAVTEQTGDQLTRGLLADARRRGPLTVLAPVIRNRKGFHSEVAAWAARHGFRQVRADGVLHETALPFRLDRFREHDIEVVVGTVTATRRAAARECIDRALELGRGVLYAMDAGGEITAHSTERACPGCGRSFGPLDPKHFSYNSSQGWCPRCRGFGELFHLPDVDRGADADAIEESWWRWQEGRREPCPECAGARLRPESRAVRLDLAASPSSRKGPSDSPSIVELGRLPVGGAGEWFGHLKPTGRAGEICRDILPEIRERLRFLGEVGLDYLQLDRSVTTLSGGEAQRIRLAAQLGSTLSGVLYVLDEPTVGLHSRDNARLLESLARLRDRGNSLVVVEHDEDTMRQADHIIDLGPGAGVHGGRVVAAGTLADLVGNPDSITGRSVRSRPTFPSRGERRPVPVPPPTAVRGRRRPAATGGFLVLNGARRNNLANLTVAFPTGRFTAVTGVSGSGKSTLVKECLLPALQAALSGKGAATDPEWGTVSGHASVHAVHEVDQSPIGRTPRSTPATYVGFFDDIRKIFATTPEARLRGYGPGRFSFNSAEGRCPGCEGAGFRKLEMNFLPPAHARCETCQGRRFNPETLDVRWSGRTIAEVLDLSVSEAMEAFTHHPRILRALTALQDTGLGYLRLGQTSPTLSGGEAQRVRLVAHLLTGLKPATTARGIPRPSTRDCFLLEEPTIGLHIEDVRKLVEVLQRLVDAGHTVVVIEHNLDLIAEADWVVDLGPEGGAGGGHIVAVGSPEEVSRVRASHTGPYLGRHLRGE